MADKCIQPVAVFKDYPDTSTVLIWRMKILYKQTWRDHCDRTSVCSPELSALNARENCNICTWETLRLSSPSFVNYLQYIRSIMGDYINNPQFMKYHYDISKYTTLGPATNALQIFRSAASYLCSLELLSKFLNPSTNREIRTESIGHCWVHTNDLPSYRIRGVALCHGGHPAHLCQHVFTRFRSHWSVSV